MHCRCSATSPGYYMYVMASAEQHANIVLEHFHDVFNFWFDASVIISAVSPALNKYQVVVIHH